jgi:hypothetical protein
MLLLPDVARVLKKKMDVASSPTSAATGYCSFRLLLAFSRGGARRALMGMEF